MNGTFLLSARLLLSIIIGGSSLSSVLGYSLSPSNFTGWALSDGTTNRSLYFTHIRSVNPLFITSGNRTNFTGSRFGTNRASAGIAWSGQLPDMGTSISGEVLLNATTNFYGGINIVERDQLGPGSFYNASYVSYAAPSSKYIMQNSLGSYPGYVPMNCTILYFWPDRSQQWVNSLNYGVNMTNSYYVEFLVSFKTPASSTASDYQNLTSGQASWPLYDTVLNGDFNNSPAVAFVLSPLLTNWNSTVQKFNDFDLSKTHIKISVVKSARTGTNFVAYYYPSPSDVSIGNSFWCLCKTNYQLGYLTATRPDGSLHPDFVLGGPCNFPTMIKRP